MQFHEARFVDAWSISTFLPLHVQILVIIIIILIQGYESIGTCKSDVPP